MIPDSSLRRLLRSAHEQPAPVSTAGFRASVWARIDARRHTPQPWWAPLREHFTGVAPVALACVVVVLAAGAGGWAAKVRVADSREAMVERYVSSIDPQLRGKAHVAHLTR